MRNRWRLILVMALVLGIYGGGSDSGGTQLATATILPSAPVTTSEAAGGSGSQSTVGYQVERGDNLWSIAKHHLAVRRERSPKEFGDREIAAYWRKVIAANARTLRSGDPDRIYPDETIVLPYIAAAPTSPATTPAPSTTSPPGQGGANEPSPGEGEASPKPPEARPYTVVAGDNLWTIARDRLIEARAGGSGKPTIREVAAYWLQVIDANRHRLRSGDPDLIYPGERIDLPLLD
jgi:nucleoid-associated protein YgaU